MANREWGWELLRVGAAVALICGCGWIIWNRTARPLIEKGLGPAEALREVKLGVHRWSFERRKEEMKREIEAAKAAARGGAALETGSQGTAPPPGEGTPSK
jgi:hypothetical protein